MSLGSSGWKLKSKHRSQRLKFPKWTLEADSKGYSIPADSHVKMLKFTYALSWFNKSTADLTIRSCFPAYFIHGCCFNNTWVQFSRSPPNTSPTTTHTQDPVLFMQLRCVGFSCSCSSPDYCLMRLGSMWHFLFCGNNTWDKINPFSSDYLGHG